MMTAIKAHRDWRSAPPLIPPLALAVLLCSVGCEGSRVPAVDGDAGPIAQACNACHGGDKSDAPPKALDGSTATTSRGVGAHQSHLSASATARAVTCNSCHVVPKTVYAEGHLDAEDGKATVTLVSGSWDAQTATCSNVACHGASLKSPGKFASPVWTTVDGSQRACDACHGASPAAPHPTSTKCEGCHAETAGAKMTIIDVDKHINGKVEVVLSATPDCDGCHMAPPAAPHPNDDKCVGCHAKSVGPGNELLAVGLHRNGTPDVDFGPETDCAGCHMSPPAAPHPALDDCASCHAKSVAADKSIIDGGMHRDGKVDVSVVTGADCSACHGAPPPPEKNHPKMDQCELCHADSVGPNKTLLTGGSHNNGTVEFALAVMNCTSCHGYPPDKPNHPKMKNCSPCHAGTVNEKGDLIAKGDHVNGVLDMKLPTGCVACHGMSPPPDHNGETDPTLPSVGAHAAHLNGDAYSGGGIKCDACHVLPEEVNVAGHLLGTLKSVLFPAGLASWGGSKPTYDSDKLTCSGVYCHGNKLDGGTVPMPKWTDTQLSCDGCHAIPPPPVVGHPKGNAGDTSTCGICHSKTMGPNGNINKTSGTHINGQVDL